MVLKTSFAGLSPPISVPFVFICIRNVINGRQSVRTSNFITGEEMKKRKEFYSFVAEKYVYYTKQSSDQVLTGFCRNQM